MAASTPVGSAIHRDSSIAAAVSSAEAGSRYMMVLKMGCPVMNDWPKSPCSTPISHVTYWTGAGRSRPNAARSVAAETAVVFVPRMTETVSPGTRWIRVNETTEIPKSTGMMLRRRLTK